MGCSDWAEILRGNVSGLQEHPIKISHDWHAWFGRCFRTARASWARREHFVVIWHCRRGPLWDRGRLARVFLGKFCMVVTYNRQKYALNDPFICILIIKSLKSTR